MFPRGWGGGRGGTSKCLNFFLFSLINKKIKKAILLAGR